SLVATAAAEPVRYEVQPDASELTFLGTSVLANAHGKFSRFGGEIVADPAQLSTARVKLAVETASLDTGIKKRDTHLRSEEFLSSDRFPTATFQSVRVEGSG